MLPKLIQFTLINDNLFPLNQIMTHETLSKLTVISVSFAAQAKYWVDVFVQE